MKKTPYALKIAVLTFSLGLGAWFIAYRSGLFDTSKTGAEDAAGDALRLGDMPNDSPRTVRTAHAADPMGEDSVSQVSTTPPSVEPPKARHRSEKIRKLGSAYDPSHNPKLADDMEIMSSSKSGAIFSPSQSTQASDTPEQRTRTMMGSTKSAEVFSPPPVQVNAPNSNSPSTAPRRIMGSSKSAAVFERPKLDTVKRAPSQAPNQPPK